MNLLDPNLNEPVQFETLVVDVLCWSRLHPRPSRCDDHLML